MTTSLEDGDRVDAGYNLAEQFEHERGFVALFDPEGLPELATEISGWELGESSRVRRVSSLEADNAIDLGDGTGGPGEITDQVDVFGPPRGHNHEDLYTVMGVRRTRSFPVAAEGLDEAVIGDAVQQRLLGRNDDPATHTWQKCVLTKYEVRSDGRVRKGRTETWFVIDGNDHRPLAGGVDSQGDHILRIGLGDIGQDSIERAMKEQDAPEIAEIIEHAARVEDVKDFMVDLES